MFTKGVELVNLTDTIVDYVSKLSTRAEQEDAIADVRAGLSPGYYPIVNRVIEDMVEWKE